MKTLLFLSALLCASLTALLLDSASNTGSFEPISDRKASPASALQAPQVALASSTNPPTDYVKDIIKVPEMEETKSNVPTSIKDIKAADPSAGVVMIQPPVTSSMGAATLQFPIKIPTGRQGMQPQLAIQYNSAAGNDWLGLGWDLSLPFISVETRWAVRYDAGLETETYTVNGQQLYPVAHRGALVGRSAEKVFHLRIEGSFHKIVRHGDSPKNYWWELVAKNGTRSFYGGKNGVDDSAVLKDEDGNIGYWALVEVRDLNDNFMIYRYDKVADTGLENGSVPGHQLYPNYINYTGHGTTNGKYAVLFVRDRQLPGWQKREDVIISGRLGLKQVTADLLRKIVVTFEETTIRTYELEYMQGAFHKTLLKSIAEVDKNGDEFYRHEFEYFDEVRQGENYQPYQEQEDWELASDLGGETAATGTSSAQSDGNGTVFTVGLVFGNWLSKGFTVGGGYTNSSSRGEGLIALVDIDSDGLPDKVFRQDGKLWFRKNLSGDTTGTAGFSDKRPIHGIEHFSASYTENDTEILEANPFPLYLGSHETDSKTSISTYFADFNGDGLMDIARDGKVFFNHLNANGEPTFTTQSNDTPSPIVDGAAINPAVITTDPNELDTLINKYPLHDIVRVWQAPCPGMVTLDAAVNLIPNPNAAASSEDDGVRLAIQHEGTVLWSDSVAADDYLVRNPSLPSFFVNKGDRIFFRVQSRFNGTFDQVHWSPRIMTNFTPGGLDPNGKDVQLYDASADYLTAAPQEVPVFQSGTVLIGGTFTKPITSDALTLQVLNITPAGVNTLFSQTFDWNQTATSLPINDSFVLASNTALQFRVIANTNIDWSAIAWNPQVTLPVNGQELVICPSVAYSMFNHVKQKSEAWTPSAGGSLTISPTLGFSPSDSGLVTMSAKGVQKWLGDTTFMVNGGLVPPVTLQVTVAANEPIFVEFHVPDRALADAMTPASADLLLNGGAVGNVQTGIYSTLTPDESLLGPLYRGWGQFVYNGNRNRANEPIHTAELVMDPALLAQAGNPLPTTIAGLSNLIGLETLKFFPMFPDAKSGTWLGIDNLCYLRDSVMSSSRMGKDHLLSAYSTLFGTDAKAAHKIHESETESFSAGAAILGTLSWSSHKMMNKLDVFDLNGDRYPDVVGDSLIQYTTARGGLEADSVANFIGVHATKGESEGYTRGGTTVLSKSANTGGTSGHGSFRLSNDLSSLVDRLGNSANEAPQASVGSISVSLSGNFNEGVDSTARTFLDINADALPDMVYEDGRVALNLGHRFTAPEQWGFKNVRTGSSEDSGISGGVGYNVGNMSIAGGCSYSKTEASTTQLMQDLNGDGLLDLLFPDMNLLHVSLNRGNGFADPIPWAGATFVDDGVSHGTSCNWAITYCHYIFPIFRGCFNYSSFSGDSESREKNQISDMDGDGYPDVLYSNNDGDLRVRRSTIGRTNLLKRVSRPFHSSFALDYELQGNTYEMPHAVWAMSSLEVEDGFAGDGADRMRYAFEYEGGFHNRHEREFYGFQTVRTHHLDTENSDAAYRTLVQTFANDSYYRKGLLLNELLTDAAGNPYTETRHTYELKDIFTGAALPPAFANNDNAAAFPALTQTTRLFYEGQTSPGLQTTSTFEHDTIGNVSTFTDFGDGSPEDWSQAKIAYHNNVANYIKSTPSAIEVSIGSGLLRRRQTSIDPLGNVIQIRQFFQSDSSANHDIEFDGYGNIAKMTRPLNHKGEHLVLEYAYDDVVHTYPVEVRDGYGYVSGSVYEYLFGQMLESTDINQQKTRYGVDDRGRVDTITGPYELASGQPYTLLFEYHPEAAVPYARTRHFDPEHSADIKTYTFMDGLLRPLQVKKTGAVFTNSAAADDSVMIVSGRAVFDAFGRNTESFYPITEPLGTNNEVFNPVLDTIAPTKTTYDLLDRKRSVTLPDGAATLMDYAIGADNTGYAAFQTTATDPLGNVSESYTDVRGRNRATMDLGPLGEIWTGFRYNGLSELVKVLDHDGNATDYAYDLLGRKLSANHPASGLTEFRYDPAGNLTAKVTANIRASIPNGGAILYHYEMERLREIHYPKNFQNKVQFSYGEPGAPHFRAGRIWLQEDASGGQEFFYSRLGEVVKNIRTLLITESNVRTFVSQFEYDTWNRIQKMRYPDGEVLDYRYNRAGKLQSLSGEKQGKQYQYVLRMGYDKFEQRTFLEHGNGSVTHYAYTPERRWLSQMDVSNTSGRTFIDNSYGYDAVGNILSIVNAGQRFHLQPGGPMSCSYSYDQLYRLSAASGNWTGFNRRDSFALQMEYDNLHNILRKNQLHLRDTLPQPTTSYDQRYEYMGNQPHAPTRVGNRLFAYDANGNLSGWQGENDFKHLQIVWDEENRIMGVSKDGYISRYTYDAGGERAIKSHGGVQGVFTNGAPAGVVSHRDNYTAYVSPYLTATEHGFTKYYHIEGQRLVGKVGTGKFQNKQWFGRGITAGNRNYAERIQLLQQSAWGHYGSLNIAPGPPTLPAFYGQPEQNGTPHPPFPSDSAYINAPMGWPQPSTAVPGIVPGTPTLSPDSTVTNDNVQAGYGFFGDGHFNMEGNQFFFHPDHLGSTSYVTDINGQVRQHTAYLPFGELMVDEHSTVERQPYLFNAKELDAETGLYYYGARYYDPQGSIWASVDPMAEKYPGWSTYNYALLNPVRFVDPDGREVLFFELGFRAGGSISKKLGLGVTFSLSIGLAFDFDDEMRGMLYFKKGAGPSIGNYIGFGESFGWSNAPSYKNLIGLGADIGAVNGGKYGSGIEYNKSFVQDENGKIQWDEYYEGFTVSPPFLGISEGKLIYADITKTTPIFEYDLSVDERGDIKFYPDIQKTESEKPKGGIEYGPPGHSFFRPTDSRTGVLSED